MFCGVVLGAFGQFSSVSFTSKCIRVSMLSGFLFATILIALDLAAGELDGGFSVIHRSKKRSVNRTRLLENQRSSTFCQRS